MNQNQPKTDTLIAFAERLIANDYPNRTHFLGHFIANELANQFPEQFEKRVNLVYLRNSDNRLESHLGKAFNLPTPHQEDTLYKIFNHAKFYQSNDRDNVTKEQIVHAVFDFCVTLNSGEFSNN